MKKIFTLLVAASIGATSFGQVFESNLSSWSGGNPTDWFGSKTTIGTASVTEVTVGATYGTSMASLVNTTNNHKRFTTVNVEATAGATYDIKIWLGGLAGEMRTNYYDVTNDAFGSYNPYVTLSGGTQTTITQSVTLPAGCDSAQFILSLRNTDAVGIIVDSVSITSGTAPVATPATIYAIQYTTTAPYDSPYNTQLIETSGVVTGVQYNGYYLQDGNGAWNGVFVLDYNNVPTIGDVVTVTGTVDEYFNFTTVKNISVYNAVGGGTLPTATSLTTLAANDEQYEGVLLSVVNANCTADTATSGNGEWTVDDGSGALIIDDKMFNFGPTVSTLYDVTGVMDYSFNNFKLLPRDLNDVGISISINELEKENVSVYPNPVKEVINFKLESNANTILLLDVTGKTVKSIKANNTSVKVPLSNLDNGIYFYKVINNVGNVVAANKFVVAK